MAEIIKRTESAANVVRTIRTAPRFMPRKERRKNVDNVNVITQAISTLGFPIAMCAALFWYMIQQRKQHEEESEKWQQALNNNTAILKKLYEKLG